MTRTANGGTVRAGNRRDYGSGQDRCRAKGILSQFNQQDVLDAIAQLGIPREGTATPVPFVQFTKDGEVGSGVPAIPGANDLKFVWEGPAPPGRGPFSRAFWTRDCHPLGPDIPIPLGANGAVFRLSADAGLLPSVATLPPTWDEAASALAGDKPDTHRAIKAALFFPELLRRAERFVSSSAGRLVFDATAAHSAGISVADTAHLQRSVAHCNQLIAGGSFRVVSGVAIEGLSPLLSSGVLLQTKLNGQDYKLDYEWKWFGQRFYINKALLEKILDFVLVGIAVAEVVAALEALGIVTIPHAALIALIGAIAFLGYAALHALDFCNGIYILIPWTVPVPIPYPA